MNHKQQERLLEENNKKLNPPKAISKNILEDPVCKGKLLFDEAFLKDDMLKAASKLFASFKLDFDQHFLLIEDLTKINASIISKKKTFFCIYDREDKHWSLFCMLQDEKNSTIILHKDSTGRNILNNLEKSILKRIPNAEILNHPTKEQHDGKLFGPFCLRNLNIMLKHLTENQTEFIKNFSQIQFCGINEINSLKFDLVIKSTIDLAKNTVFLQEFQNFIEKLPMELEKDIIKFQEILEEELEKGEKNYNAERVKEARKKLNSEKVKTFCDAYKMDKKSNDFKFEIETKYPKELKAFSNIFITLSKFAVDENFFKGLKNISEILKLDYNKLKVFYKTTQNKTKNDKQLRMKTIETLIKELPISKPAISGHESNTSISQLLNELVLGIDGKKSILHEDIKRLRQQFDLVKKKSKLWKNATAKSINNWAKANKKKFIHNDETLCEIIAIMDRAYFLLKTFNLRAPQILAVLIFFNKPNPNKGVLVQIKTGEGKTVIVAILATIKALQGQLVDVITSNEILAKEGVEETENLYNLFDLTVATNNAEEKEKKSHQEPKIAYKADVLYGTISNFQFDYLKDNFEGFSIRHDRKFGQVILDEVDSMLIDNGGNIAKLSSPFPGMECLRYIYIKIWQELHSAEELFKKEMTDNLRKKADEWKNEADEDQSAKLMNYVTELARNERKFLKDKIRASEPHKIQLIPHYLQKYCDNKLEIWIKNAIHVKYDCHEFQQYRLIEDGSKEKIVVPVDYQNTGVTLKNTIWSNGVHQFIQLKHNLRLTFESLTSSFISNIGYIKNYSCPNIFGLTGTLGSTSEQELLASIYQVDYAKLPTYKPKIFQELQGLLVDDDDYWANEVALNILKQICDKRAVLVICETEADLHLINSNLKIINQIQDIKIQIRVFANEDNANETKKKVQIGDVIISTNIAGRGTNFKTTKELEANGGLHVCVGFLPCNQRVEDQAFGRTSRQGNKGTAQLILRRREVDELNLPDGTRFFTIIKNERDYLETQRLGQIKDVLVKELNYKDAIFKEFSKLYNSFKFQSHHNTHFYLVQDLKEFWAFWLENKNYSGKNLPINSPAEEFKQFEKEAAPILNGQITHNPNYCVSLADSFLEEEQYHEANRLAKQAIKISKNGFCPGAHLKCFEIAMTGNPLLMKRLKKAFLNLIFVEYNENEYYKTSSALYLHNALKMVKNEITYMDKNLKVTENVEENNFNKILVNTGTKNTFLDHINGRNVLLKIYQENISSLLKELKTVKDGLSIREKLSTDEKTLSKISDNNDNLRIVTNHEVFELKSVHLSSIYYLKVTYDVPHQVIFAARAQILSGLAMLSGSLFFLPASKSIASLACTLLSEGIMDIVDQVMSNGEKEFDLSAYQRDKFLTYGMSLLSITFTVKSIAQRILKRTIRFLKKISSILLKSPILKNLCKNLAEFVKQVQYTCQQMLRKAQITKKQISRTELLKDFTKNFAESLGKRLKGALINKLVLEPLYKLSCGKILEHIRRYVEENLKSMLRSNLNVCKKLKTCHDLLIDNQVKAFLKTNKHLAKTTSLQLVKYIQNQKLNLLVNFNDLLSIKLKDIIIIGTDLTNYLEKNLPDGGLANNDVNFFIENISATVVENFMNLLVGFINVNITLPEMINNNYQEVIKNVNQKQNEKLQDSNSDRDAEKLLNAKVKNSYEILMVSPNASKIEIRIAYCRHALRLYPRKGTDATKKFEEIQNAYEIIISTEEKEKNK